MDSGIRGTGSRGAGTDLRSPRVGKSAADTVKTTLRRSAQSLHALLQRLRISPPYILVGASWGGVVTRAYFDQYAQEVAGLVFLDAVNPGRTRDESAKSAPPEEREAILATPTFPPIPPDTPPGLRAEYELIMSEMGASSWMRLNSPGWPFDRRKVSILPRHT